MFGSRANASILMHDTPNRCTYTVPLFDQFSEKALNNFMPEYLVPETEYSANSSQTRKIQITQHLLNV
jgi:hypothetical protein